MATRSQVEVGTTPCVCGMRPPAVPSAPSQGIRVGSTACRFHPMATRSQVEVGTTPCVCGMRPPAVPSAPSPGIRLWSTACRFHPMATRSQVEVGTTTVRLWDATTGSPLRTLTGHTAWVYSVSFSPDGNTLASGSWDGTVLLWELAPAPVVSEKIAADVNTDGVVNIQDVVLVASNFGKTGENVADVNNDGVVNIIDLTLVAGGLGNAAGAPSVWGLDREIAPTREQVQQWLHQARQVNLTDSAFQRGILVLEHLLVTLTPKQTALLPNYPNPFNPETWIPYQLAAPTDVTVSIYSADGRLVQILALGHQPVGLYESRSRAAYWDGRNALGESVASGVYFYTLTAGDFTATRKMLIRK